MIRTLPHYLCAYGRNLLLGAAAVEYIRTLPSRFARNHIKSYGNLLRIP